MFTLSQSSSYLWPVTIRTAANGGRFDSHVFEVEFRRIRMSEAEPISRQIGAGELSMEDAARAVITGWKGIKDGGADDIEFSPAALSRLLEVPFVAAVLVRAWQESLTGALEKN